MGVENSQPGKAAIVNYELDLTEEEAERGTSRVLPRNGKRLQVTIPAGMKTGNTVKLTNALQVTDGQAGDILIQIRVKSGEEATATAAPAGVLVITDATFPVEVLGAELPVVVDFWAPWCGPCRAMSPMVEECAKLYAGRFKFCKINVDENPQMASQYQAMSIPMLLFFNNGRVVDKSVGAIPLAQLRMKMDELPV